MRIKKIILITFIFLTGVTYLYADDSMSIEPSSIDLSDSNVGDTISVDIKINRFPEDAAAIKMLLNYDTSIIQYNSYQEFATTDFGAETAYIEKSYMNSLGGTEAGYIVISSLYLDTPSNSSGKLYTLTFTLESKTSSEIKFYNNPSNEKMKNGFFKAGNVIVDGISTSNAYLIMPDNTPPAINNFKIDTNKILGSPVTSNFEISDSSIASNSSVSVYFGNSETTIDSRLAVITGDTTANSISCTFTISSASIPDTGTYYIKVTASDSRGNTTSETDSFTVIDWPITITAPVSTSFNTSAVTITIKGSSDESISVIVKNYTNNDTNSVTNVSSFDLSVPLNQDTNIITLTASVSGRNDYVETYTVFCDSNPPQLSFVIDNDTLYTTDTEVILSLTGTDAGIGIDSIRYKENDGGYTSWDTFVTSKTFYLSDAEGTKTIYVQVKDKLGLTNETNSSIYLDYTAPVVSFNITGNEVTNIENIVLNISANDPSGIGKIVLGGDINETGETSYTASKNVTLTAANGVKTVTVVCYDKLGNYSEVTQDTVVFDNMPPNISHSRVSTSGISDIIEISNVTVTDTYSNIIRVSLFYYYTETAETSVTGLNAKSVTVDLAIPPRGTSEEHKVYYYLKAVDAAGNIMYDGLNGGSLTAPSDTTVMYEILCQDATLLTVNELDYVQGTNILASSAVEFTVTAGVYNQNNTLKIYNSETGSTTSVSLTSTPNYNTIISFNSDGQKTIIFTASTEGGFPPENVKQVNFFIDTTDPVLNVWYPYNKQVFKSGAAKVVGEVSDSNSVAVAIYANNEATGRAASLQGNYFSYNFPDTSDDSQFIVVKATDAAGHVTTSLPVYFYHKDFSNDPTTKIFDILSAAAISSIDSLVKVVSFSLNTTQDVLNGKSPDTFQVPPLELENGGKINLSLSFDDTSTPIDLKIEKVEPTDEVAAGAFTQFGSSEDLSEAEKTALISTIRSFELTRRGKEYDNTNDTYIKDITLEWIVPDGIDVMTYTVYTYDETNKTWVPIEEQFITREPDNNKISAELTHFSKYGIFEQKNVPPETVIKSENVIIFPNPYIPNDGKKSTGVDYELDNTMGGIHIKGLTNQANIKIYSLLGELIIDKTVTGTGMAIWDAKNKDGKKVSSGIYFIMIKGTGGTVVKKVAIVR